MAAAWLYGGETAVRHDVEVSRSGQDLLIAFADESSASVPAALLTFVESRSDCTVYGRTDIAGWRLGIGSAAAPDLAGILPAKAQYGRWIDRIGLVPAILLGVAVSAAVLFAGNQFPKWAAPYVPKEWEDKFGDTLVGDFGGKYCDAAPGQAALAALAARLSPDAAALNIRVVDIGMVNAAALPGGNIVIFDALLEEAKGPDEVAGILAHEIAHIEERHVTQAMIRQFGLGMIANAFGGNVGGNIDMVLAASYSRSAEREADAGAIKTLARAGISPVPTADFFARLAREEDRLGRFGEGLAYISTHPLSAERRRHFRESAERGRAYPPSLSPAQWRALTRICKAEPDAE